VGDGIVRPLLDDDALLGERGLEIARSVGDECVGGLLRRRLGGLARRAAVCPRNVSLCSRTTSTPFGARKACTPNDVISNCRRTSKRSLPSFCAPGASVGAGSSSSSVEKT
jgi:hypothetical protein